MTKRRVLAGILAVLGLLGLTVLAAGGQKAQAAIASNAALYHEGNLAQVFNLNGPHKTRVEMVHGRPLTTTYYEVKRNDGLNTCLDDPNAGGSGTKQQVWSCNGRSQQFWAAETSTYGSGTIVIVNYANEGDCLDDTGLGGSGTRVQIYICLDNQNQSWNVYTMSGGISGNKMCVTGLNQCLDDKNGSSSDGNPVQVWQWNDLPNQAWCISSTWPHYHAC